jgi:hypothetical protein
MISSSLNIAGLPLGQKRHLPIDSLLVASVILFWRHNLISHPFPCVRGKGLVLQDRPEGQSDRGR